MLDQISQKYWHNIYTNNFKQNELVVPFETPEIIMQGIGDYYKNHLVVLRDDLIPYYLGGNKARKAYFYQKKFEKNGIDCVLTYGSAKSNHARSIALMAQSIGIDSILISPDDEKSLNNNQRIRLISNMKVISSAVSEVEQRISETMLELNNKYSNPFFIPGGGHDIIGITAIVDLMFKIQEWEKKQNFFFNKIYFASGTGGTQAGLIIGKKIVDFFRKKEIKNDLSNVSDIKSDVDILGISIARQKENGIAAVVDAFNIFSDCFSSSEFVPEKNEDIDVNFNTKYILGGYGDYNKDISNLIFNILKRYQLPLDPIYTGKAFYGMTEELKKIKGEKILFIHTGGTPLFYDFLENCVTK